MVIPYAWECLGLITAKQLNKIEKKERNILKTIMGPKYGNGIYKIKSNEEMYKKIELIVFTTRKKWYHSKSFKML